MAGVEVSEFQSEFETIIKQLGKFKVFRKIFF